VKYSPLGEAIHVRVQKGRPGMVRFVVADRGPGIDATQREKLFRRYVKLQAKPTGGESSTGLGLAAALQETQWMGGELWHEPRPDGGSMFIIELPLASAAEEAA